MSRVRKKKKQPTHNLSHSSRNNCGKRTFFSRADAKRFTKDRGKLSTSKKTRVYQCTDCNCWHLTTTPDYRRMNQVELLDYLIKRDERRLVEKTGATI